MELLTVITGTKMGDAAENLLSRRKLSSKANLEQEWTSNSRVALFQKLVN